MKAAEETAVAAEGAADVAEERTLPYLLLPCITFYYHVLLGRASERGALWLNSGGQGGNTIWVASYIGFHLQAAAFAADLYSNQ